MSDFCKQIPKQEYQKCFDILNSGKLKKQEIYISRYLNQDETLVNDIAKVNINGKEKYFYSFATKYCSHHYPTVFPIYDSYVEKVLLHFNKKDKFYEFRKEIQQSKII